MLPFKHKKQTSKNVADTTFKHHSLGFNFDENLVVIFKNAISLASMSNVQSPQVCVNFQLVPRPFPKLNKDGIFKYKVQQFTYVMYVHISTFSGVSMILDKCLLTCMLISTLWLFKVLKIFVVINLNYLKTYSNVFDI